jgi:hypothetical protein
MPWLALTFLKIALYALASAHFVEDRTLCLDKRSLPTRLSAIPWLAVTLLKIAPYALTSVHFLQDSVLSLGWLSLC